MTDTAQKPERAVDPSVRVTVGGRERELRFGMWSICQLEEATGQPWHQVLGEIRRDFGRANVRLLWACLQHEKDPPSLREVAQSIPMGGEQRPIFDAALNVMLESLGNAGKEEGEDKGPLDEDAAA